MKERFAFNGNAFLICTCFCLVVHVIADDTKLLDLVSLLSWLFLARALLLAEVFALATCILSRSCCSVWYCNCQGRFLIW